MTTSSGQACRPWPFLTLGGKLVATFLVYLAVSTLIAYLTRVALPGPAPFGAWFGAYRRTLVASFIDGIAYGCITGAIFAWFWQH